MTDLGCAAYHENSFSEILQQKQPVVAVDVDWNFPQSKDDKDAAAAAINLSTMYVPRRRCDLIGGRKLKGEDGVKAKNIRKIKRLKPNTEEKATIYC